jgi:hypothetical protein
LKNYPKNQSFRIPKILKILIQKAKAGIAV